MLNGGNGLGWLLMALRGGIMGLQWVLGGFWVAFSGLRPLILLELGGFVWYGGVFFRPEALSRRSLELGKKGSERPDAVVLGV